MPTKTYPKDQAKLNSLKAHQDFGPMMQRTERNRQMLEEVADQKMRDKISAMGYKNGGMVKMTPKATPYKCGGKVK